MYDYDTRTTTHFHILLVKSELGITGVRYRGAITWNGSPKDDINPDISEAVFKKYIKMFVKMNTTGIRYNTAHFNIILHIIRWQLQQTLPVKLWTHHQRPGFVLNWLLHLSSVVYHFLCYIWIDLLSQTWGPSAQSGFQFPLLVDLFLRFHFIFWFGGFVDVLICVYQCCTHVFYFWCGIKHIWIST